MGDEDQKYVYPDHHDRDRPESFVGSVNARIRELEHQLEIRDSQFAMALFQRDVAERRLVRQSALETAIMKARTALRPHVSEHDRQDEISGAKREVLESVRHDCPACYAADVLEEVDR
jgi:hypothetical protein